ncbi:MAG: ParB/RepB/Spo0J family partition protein [Planctomycetota bacterium]
MNKRKRLGRGLEALLSNVPDSSEQVTLVSGENQETSEASRTTSEEGAVVQLNVYEIDDNPFQPRRQFSESEISSLAESLKEHDILQPILVRRVNGRHQLISGERRLRAAIQANWQTIPARIREADDRLVAELAIVENLQRKDLNPIEKAMSFRRYIDEHHCTQEDLASRLKIDRSTLANLMRLLELPRQIQDSLSNAEISAGHARALLPLGEEPIQIEFCQRIRNEGWSVRDTERAVSDRISEEESAGTANLQRRARRVRSSHLDSLEQQLKFSLGTGVKIKQNASGRGKIQIEFANSDEFERLHAILVSEGQQLRVA